MSEDTGELRSGTESKPPRAEQTIFEELRVLAATPGFAHIIAYLCARDNFTLFSGEIIADDMQHFYSRSRLIRTEMFTLIGLMVQAAPDYAAPPPEDAADLVARTDRLLGELHDSLSEPWRQSMRAMFQGTPEGSIERPEADLREAIFYGGEGGFPFQSCELATLKYREDAEWLMTRYGVSIDEIVAVALAMDEATRFQVSEVLESGPLMAGDPVLLEAFMVDLDQVAQRLNGDPAVVRSAIAPLTFGPSDRNLSFQRLSDFNAVNASPVLECRDGRRLLFHFNALAEALYESPYYWMAADEAYKTTHFTHRGNFAESFALSRLEAVFGPGRVYRGVYLEKRKGERIEIDVLAVFADRAVVIEVKSKRLTLEARRGNDLQIRRDFQDGVQAAYDQAFRRAEQLLDPAVKLVLADGQVLKLEEPIRQVHPICVVADHYPALNYQTGQFLKARAIDGVLAPLVIDVFALDAICEMLDRPLRLLSYLELRARFGPKMIFQHEMTLLAYHLKYNLWPDDDHDAVVLEDDFVADLEIAMSARRIGLPGRRTPEGILTAINGRVLDQVLMVIEASPQASMVELGLLFYELSGRSIEFLANGVDRVIMEAGQRERSDFSMGFAGTGVSVHSNTFPAAEAAQRLEAHLLVRKYDTKSNSWFGLSLEPSTGRVRMGKKVSFDWEEDPVMDEVMTQFRATMPRETSAE